MIEVQINSILAFLWAFVISVFAIPSIVHVAHLKNLLDEPNARAMHSTVTPRLGGLAIFAGFISAITIFGEVTPAIQRLIAGCMMLFFIGLKDDVISISAFKKFFIQIIATGIVVFIGNIRLTNFQGFMGIYELPLNISYGLTFLIIVGVTNALNLIDGLDGLAGSLTFTIAAILGSYFYMNGNFPFAILAFCMMGALAGFLRYNITRAIIFMGDTGSLVCGFLVSVMAIQFVELGTVESAPSIAVAILFIPVFDTARIFMIRIMKGQSPFNPDKNHIHHILSRAGLSQLGTVATLVGFNVAVVFYTVGFAHLGDTFLLLSLVGFFVIITAVLAINEKLKSAKRQVLNKVA